MINIITKDSDENIDLPISVMRSQTVRNFFTKDKYPAPEFETPLPDIYPK